MSHQDRGSFASKNVGVDSHVGHFTRKLDSDYHRRTPRIYRRQILRQYVDIYAHQATVEGRVVQSQASASGPERGSASPPSLARVPLASQALPTSGTCPGRQGRRFGLGRLGREEIVQRGIVGRPDGRRLRDVCVIFQT